jgi:hypothetical protein
MVFGTVFSSSSFIPIISFADMPGDSMDGRGSDGGNGDDQENSGDEDDNDIPDSKEAPATAGSLTAGGDSDSDDDNDNDSGGNQDNDNDNDANEPTSKDAPVTTDTATTKKCSEGQEYTLFSGCIEAAEDPGNTGVSTSTPTTCPASYSPYERDSIRAKSEGSTTPKHHLLYMSIHSPVLIRGLEQSIGPHIQLVDDSFLDFESCTSTDEVDPKTGIITRTKTLLNGGKAIERVNEQGTISEDVYDKGGSLISSSVASTTKLDPKSINTAVSIHKGGKKDITIEHAEGGPPITKFTITKSGKIIPSNPELQVKEYFTKSGKYQLKTTTIFDSQNGVTVGISEGGRALGWKTIDAKKSDNSVLTEVIMNPKGALYR